MDDERVTLYGLPIVPRRRVRLRPGRPRRAPASCSSATRWCEGDWDAPPRLPRRQPRAGGRGAGPRAPAAARPARVRRRARRLLRRARPGRRHHRQALRPLVEARARSATPTSSPTRTEVLVEPARARSTPTRRSPSGCRSAAPTCRSPTPPTRRRTSTASWSTCRCCCSTGSTRPASTGRCRAAARSWSPRIVRALPKDVRRRARPRPRRRAAELLAGVGPGRRAAARRAAAGAGARRPASPCAVTDARPRRGPRPPAGHLPGRRRRAAGRWRGARTSPALRRRMAERLRAALTERSPLPALEGLHRLARRRPPAHRRGPPRRARPSPATRRWSTRATPSARRVLPSEAEQRTAMWGGTRRLLLLQLGSPLRTLDRSLAQRHQAGPHGQHPRRRRPRRTASATEAAVDQLLLAAGGPVWDADAFADLLARGAGRVRATPRSRRPPPVGRCWPPSPPSTSASPRMHHEALDETVVDIGAHLDRLLRRGLDRRRRRRPAARRGPLRCRALEHRARRRPPPSRPGTGPASPRSQALERDYRVVAAARSRRRRCAGSSRSSGWPPSPSPSGAKGGPSEPKVRAAIAALEAR